MISPNLTHLCFFIIVFCVGWIGATDRVDAQQAAPVAGEEGSTQPDNDTRKTDQSPQTKQSTSPDPPGLVRLDPRFNVWIDPTRKYVVADGKVCLRAGQLEMFACPQGTKEHESIVAIDCPAQLVHAGLLAIGAKPGKPAQFDPMYVPATGAEIEIWVLWKDKEGTNRKMRAQKWVRDIRLGKAMTHSWVFAGSGFWKDEETGMEHYLADGGDFICVSNFTTATLDLTVESSDSADGLLFEAFTENIPNRGTHVRLVLIPKLEEATEKKTD